MDIIAFTLFIALVLVTLMYLNEKVAHEHWKEEAEFQRGMAEEWRNHYMEEITPDSVKLFRESAEGAARSFGEEAAKAFGKMQDD